MMLESDLNSGHPLGKRESNAIAGSFSELLLAVSLSINIGISENNFFPMPQLFDNRYHFVRELGGGGFGRVFLAREDNAEFYVAIKQLHNQDKDYQDNIIHEMRVLSRFNHPHIVNYKHQFVQDDLLLTST